MAQERPPQFAEDDDMARARAFWDANGKPIVAGVVLGLAGIVGFNFWQGYQQDQGESASVLFDTVRLGETTEAASALQSLQSDYTETTYASLAALSMAARHVQEGDLEAASGALRWAMEKGSDDAISGIARARLASVLIASGNAQEALDLVAGQSGGNFESRYRELEGDAYSLRGESGDREKALAAWEASLAAADGSASPPELIQLKIDNLGV